MTWPQVVMLVWMLFATVVSIRLQVSSRHESAGMVTLGVMLVLALQAFIAFVLHAGGFW